MKMVYAEVVSITSQDMMIGGFVYGMHVSQHEVAVTQVTFSGGYQFPCLGELHEDGSVMANGFRISVGDKVRLMTLTNTTVVASFMPVGIAHLPAAELVHHMGQN